MNLTVNSHYTCQQSQFPQPAYHQPGHCGSQYESPLGQRRPGVGAMIGGIVGGSSGLVFGIIGGAAYYMKKKKRSLGGTNGP